MRTLGSHVIRNTVHMGHNSSNFLVCRTSTDPVRPSLNVSSPWKPSRISPCRIIVNVMTLHFLLVFIILQSLFFTQLTPRPLLEGKADFCILYVQHLAECLALTRRSINLHIAISYSEAEICVKH